MKLSQILLKSNIIDEKDLDKAAQMQKDTGIRIGEALVQTGAISEEQLYMALAQELRVKYIDLSKYYTIEL